MAKQSSAEILFNNFRGMVNDGNIYVLEKRNGELVCLKEVKYLVANEYNELDNVAQINKSKYDELDAQVKREKEEAEERRFSSIFGAISSLHNELQIKHDKQVAINKKILELLKITYGASELDFGTIIALLEKEILENE